MLVERERPVDAEPLDDDAAGAVREAPLLVGELEEYFRCHLKICVGDAYDLAAALASLIDPVLRAIRMTARAKEREQLVVDVVACNKALTVRSHKSARHGVVWVAGHTRRVPRAGIYKDGHSATINNAVVIAVRQPVARRIVR